MHRLWVGPTLVFSVIQCRDRLRREQEKGSRQKKGQGCIVALREEGREGQIEAHEKRTMKPWKDCHPSLFSSFSQSQYRSRRIYCFSSHTALIVHLLIAPRVVLQWEVSGDGVSWFLTVFTVHGARLHLHGNQTETNEAARWISPIHLCKCLCALHCTSCDYWKNIQKPSWPFRSITKATWVFCVTMSTCSVGVTCLQLQLMGFVLPIRQTNVFMVQRTVYVRPIFNLPDKANAHYKHSMHTAATSQSRQCRQMLCQCLAGGSCQLWMQSPSGYPV